MFKIGVPFLGPRGPLVLPLVNPPVRMPAMKILTPIYRHICLIKRLIKPTLYSLVPPSTV